MPPLAARAMAQDRGLPIEVVVGEEVTTLGGHLLALYLEAPVRSYRSLRTTIAAVHDAGGIAIPAHPLVPYPLCAQAFALRRLLEDPDPRFHPDAIETFNPTALGRPRHQTVVRFADASRPAPCRQQRRPRPRRHRARLDVLRGPDRGGPAGVARRGHHRASRLVPRRHRPARDVRGAAAQAAAGRPRRADRPAAPGRHGSRPRLPGRAGAAAAVRRGPAMKIGLVCPYIYPEAGGVAQHVRFLYENLRQGGHDVRIITASHGPQRSSEGDILRIGVGFSMPTNGSVGTVTFSPRYISQVRALLAREQFDLLHFHEPFVPFLSLFLLRESTSVNVATFHAYAGFSPSYELGSRVMRGHAARLHGRIAVSAAARHFIDRFFPGDYKVIPNGVDIPRFANAVPIARWQDDIAQPAVRRTARAAQGAAGPAEGAADPAQDRLRHAPAGRGLGAAGARSAPLRGHTGPPGRRIPGARQRCREGPAVPDRAGLRVTRDRRRILRDRPARVDGGRDADRLLGHPRLQGRRPPRPRGPAGPAARAQGAGEGHRARPRRARPRRADGRGRPAAGRGVQLAAGHGQGRGVLRLRDPPARRRRAAPGRASTPRSLRRRRVRARLSVSPGLGSPDASDSRQTEAE